MSKKLCLFCASSLGEDPKYRRATEELATSMVSNGFDLVYGGANVGLMGVAADTVLDAGGKVYGVLPKLLTEREQPKERITQMFIVDTLAERKQKMFDLSDGFVVLPGGLGTLDELFEMMTWAYLGTHHKPIGLVNLDGYYDKLLDFIKDASKEGFIVPKVDSLLIKENSSKQLINKLKGLMAQ